MIGTLLPTRTLPQGQTILSIQTISPDEVIARSRNRCKTSLRFLCKDILGMSLWDVCHDWLEDFLEQSTKNKKLILLPREHLKTSLITIGKSIQHILDNPDVSILYASAVQSNAESFLALTKGYLTAKSKLSEIFGKFESEKWNENEILIRQRKADQISKTISVAGSDKAITSQHYDVIFLDDIVNRQTVSTLEQMEKTKKFYSDVLDLLKKGSGILYVIGTRWDERDLYGHIIKNFSDEFDVMNMQATTDGTTDGEIIFKKKFTNQILKELLRMKGSYEFNCQYMNSITSPESRIFNPPVRYWSVNDTQTSKNVITFDPATSDKRESCDAVVLASGINESSQICVLGYTIFKQKEKTPFNMMNKIFDYMNRFVIRDVVVETNGGQEVYAYLLKDESKKRKVNLNIIEVHQSRSKESRILALQPYWERGDLLLKQGMIELEDQIDRFRVPVNSMCDVLDALAMRIQKEIPLSISQSIFKSANSNYVSKKSGWINGCYIPPGPKEFEKNYQELIPS